MATQLDVAAPPAKIVLEGVGKQFAMRGQEIRALDPVDLEVHPREFVALVGPSGCGKSTILNMVAGLMEPSEGRVLYDAKAVNGPNQRVGYMTQKDTLLPWRSVQANIGVAFELRSHALPLREANARVEQIVDAVGLKGFERHFPSELSGGMRKRAALARMLVYEPETLLMDEPFGALDAQLRLVMLDQLQRLTQERCMTVLFVTHDLGEAITLADRVVVMSARPGRIRKVKEISFRRPRDVFRLRFVSEFAALYEELWDALKDEVGKGADI